MYAIPWWYIALIGLPPLIKWVANKIDRYKKNRIRIKRRKRALKLLENAQRRHVMKQQIKRNLGTGGIDDDRR